MAEQAIITTPWVTIEDGPGGEDEPGNTPAVAQEYTFIKWTDITGQPGDEIVPVPNQYDILFEAEANVLDAIAADPDYTIQPGTRVVVGNGDDPKLDQEPTQAEFDAYRAEILAVKEKEIDDEAWTTEQLDTAIGTAVDRRTWRAIIEQGRNYKKRRPKRVEQNTRLDAATQSNDANRTGYTANFGGALDPHEWGGNRIQQLYTDGAVFKINFRDPIEVPGVFKRVKIIHKTETTPAAFNPDDGILTGGGSAIEWPTGFRFTDGERYRVKFVE